MLLAYLKSILNSDAISKQTDLIRYNYQIVPSCIEYRMLKNLVAVVVLNLPYNNDILSKLLTCISYQ